MSIRATVLLLALAAAAAGCVTNPEAAAVDAAPPGQALPTGPTVEEISGDIIMSAATPARTFNYGGAFTTTTSLAENTTGFIIELEWEPASPASEQLSVWVRPAGQGSIDVPPENAAELATTPPPLAQADGPSPLRLEVPAEVLAGAGDYDIIVRASAQPAGVAAQQTFHIHLAKFEGIPFDADFSAHEEHAEGR